MPSAGWASDEPFVRTAMGQLLALSVADANVSADLAVAHAFVTLARTSAYEEWIGAVRAIVTACESALHKNSNEPGADIEGAHTHVARVLHYIETNYSNHTCNVPGPSRELRLSAPYVTRLLKRHTGLGFVAHLRRRRIAAAHTLMQTTHLSIKEIAGAIGYGCPRKFERDVKLLHGVTPSMLRRRVSRVPDLAAS